MITRRIETVSAAASEDITAGSGNVFADLGLPDAEELLVRARLTHEIYSIIRQRGLRPASAAKLLGLKQSDVSALLNGRFVDFPVDRLLTLLVRLNRNVEIIIKPVSETGGVAGIRVSAVA